MIYPDCINSFYANCNLIKRNGYCKEPGVHPRGAEYVKTYCAKTCGFCGSGNAD